MSFAIEIGHPFSGQRYYASQAKLTAKTVLMADADFLSALNITYAGQCVRCIGTKTVGIFQPNRTYFRNESNTGWIPDTQFKHLHNLDTDDAGGLLRNILRVNLHDIASFHGYWVSKGMFRNPPVKTGTSDLIDQGDRVDWSVEDVTNGFVNANLQGGLIDIGNPSAFGINGHATSGSRMTLKIGIGMENVNLVAPLDRRYGLEGCDTAGSTRNYNMLTGDGTSWSIEPTGESIQQTTPRGFIMTHTPGQNVRLYRFIGGQETFSIKTTNIPITGTIASAKPFNIGYKTNEAVAKQYKLYSLKIECKTPSTLWPNAFD